MLVAFLACGMAAQALTARTMYSIARDGVLPGSRFLRARRPPRVADRRDRRRPPSSRCLGLLLGLDSAAVGSLIAFGTAAIYVAFLLDRAGGADRPPARDVGARRAGPARPRRAWRSTSLAVVWLAFETVNIAWPRASLAPPGAPVYQVWAAPIVLAVIAVVGLVYMLIARPQRKLTVE